MLVLTKPLIYSLSNTLIIFLLLFSMPGNGEAANESSVIALFGDSITVGENVAFQGTRPDTGDGRTANDGLFPALAPSDNLDDLLTRERRTSVVVNWGRGGSTTSSGVGRISSELAVSKSSFPADNHYVLILYGTNDFNAGLSASDTGFNTGIMIDRARSSGFIPVIGTLTPRSDRNVSSYNSDIISAANSRGAPIVDHFSRYVQDGNGGLDLLDVETFGTRTIRLHPTAEGYEVITNTWFEQFLENAIEQTPAIISPIINLLLDDDISQD